MSVDGTISTSIGPAGQVNFQLAMDDSRFDLIVRTDGLQYKIKAKRDGSSASIKEQVAFSGQIGLVGDTVFEAGSDITLKAWAWTRRKRGWFRMTRFRRIRGKHAMTIPQPAGTLVSALLPAPNQTTIPGPWGNMDLPTYPANSDIGLTTQGTSGAQGYFIELRELDRNTWNAGNGYDLVSVLYSDWVSGTGAPPPNINLSQFAPNGFKPATLYAVKIAIGPVWVDNWHYFLTA